jgi:hypothetical protein
MESEDRYAATLLRPLAREPRAPSTVDISRAVADGERRRRLELVVRAGASTAVAALVLVGGWAAVAPRLSADRTGPPPSSPAVVPPSASPSASAPPAPPACTIERLPVPAGHPPKSIVTGADPTGRYIVGRSYPGGLSHPVLIWHDRQVRQVSMPGSDQEFNDITSTGVAVGTSYVGADSEQTAAWVYRDGRLTRLAGGVAQAFGINEKEAIVGSVNGKPAMWPTPTSPPTMLAMPGPGWEGYAAGIDEDGTIVGRMDVAAKPVDLGFVWRPDGRLEQLAVPTVRGAPADTYTADAIRDGQVVGWSARDEGSTRFIEAPHWNLRTGQVTSVQGRADAVNRMGWTVSGNELNAGGTIVELPHLGTASPEARTYALTISDDGGTIAGQAPLPDSEPVAVVWTCR